MKVLVTGLILLTLGSTAYAQPTADSQDNQSMPPVVVPEVLHPTSVGATLTANASDYANGQPVHLVFTVVNHSKSAMNYEFASGHMYDFVISDSTGKAIWHWSQNKVFGQLVTQMTLAPNASTSYTVTWTQRDDDDHPVPAGTYSVTAEITPMDRPVVTGNLLANPDNDPVNTGQPTIGPVESGSVNVKNTTPSVYAKTTIKIGP